MIHFNVENFFSYTCVVINIVASFDIRRTCCADSSTQQLSTLAASTFRRGSFSSDARNCAVKVLPVPGRPWSITMLSVGAPHAAGNVFSGLLPFAGLTEDDGRIASMTFCDSMTASGLMTGDVAPLKSTNLNLRIAPEVREALRKSAEQDHISISNMVEYLIVQHCQRTGISVVKKEKEDLA